MALKLTTDLLTGNIVLVSVNIPKATVIPGIMIPYWFYLIPQ